MLALEPEVLYDLHRRMVRIRLFEEEAGKLMEAGGCPAFSICMSGRRRLPRA